ncbi:MAG: hypothetical protein KAH07_03465 [Flavobacteriaceae bacterium]|nr:hypothetical protein [Flavobacteriaceae bacterium]
MNKLLILFLCVSLWSCDDGDLDIPAFEFEEEVYNCDVKNNSYTLFRLGVAEGIIVTLPADIFKPEVTTTPIEVLITAENVVYRIFNSTVSPSYFCNDIPPTTPTIKSNWTGTPGASNKILIESIEEFDNSNVLIGYRKIITFQNLKVENNGQYMSFEEGDFGETVILL